MIKRWKVVTLGEKRDVEINVCFNKRQLSLSRDSLEFSVAIDKANYGRVSNDIALNDLFTEVLNMMLAAVAGQK